MPILGGSKRRIVETTVESPAILSSLQPLNHSIEFEFEFEFESKLFNAEGIPAVIRVVSLTKPYAKNRMFLLRLRNVFDPVSDPRGTAGEEEAARSFSICGIIPGKTVEVGKPRGIDV